MASEEIETALVQLREDYARKEGRPFEYFYCPMLLRDEQTDLCMGHVVNASLPNSCRARVLQRADIDNWYGSVVESDFGVMVNAQIAGVQGVMANRDLYRKLRPHFEVDGKEVRHYPYQGGKTPLTHSPLILENESGGDVIRLVLDKSPADMGALMTKKWSMVMERDYRLSSVVTLIKSAYLTLFRMLGYSWGLSAAGLSVGHDILGKFFEETRDKSVTDVKKAAAAFFRPYRHMVRPTKLIGNTPPRGTVEDQKAGVCFGSSGRPFALLIWIRVDDELHAVLLPSFVHPDSVETYLNFLKNDTESLRVSDAIFDVEKQVWNVSPTPIDAIWPKSGDTFDFE